MKIVAEMEARSYATYSVVGGSIFVVGGLTPQQVGITSVKEFIVRERRWRPRAPLACRRQQHAAVVVGIAAATNGEEGTEKKLIGIFGGYFKEGNTWTYLSSCEVYDISEDRWHKLPDLRPKRGGPAAACLPGDSRVFVFGGDDDSSYHDSVVLCELRADWRERVTTATTAEFWIPAARMRHARANAAAIHFRGKILVAGGELSREAANIVEIFSPPDVNCPLGQWTEVAGMKQSRWCFYLLNTGDAIFALGNSVEPWNTVEAFVAPDGSEDRGNDFKDWIWSTMRPVETLAANSGAAILRL